MGVAAPSMVEMSIAPVEAQKRAENFAFAESAAVVFAAAYEGKADRDIPDPGQGSCTLDRSQKPAYTISCTHGNGKYEQTVERSFKGLTDGSSGGDSSRNYNVPFPTLGLTGTQCHTWEQWGIDTDAFDKETGTWVKKSCTPFLLRHSSYYRNSDPNNWLYDVNNFNGWGTHQNY